MEILLKVISCLVLFPLIGSGTGQFFPQHGRDCHTGGRRLVLIAIVYFRILPESHFHSCRRPYNEVINPAAFRFYKCKLPAHYVGAARPDHG